MTKTAIDRIEKLVAQVTQDVNNGTLDARLDALKILQPFYSIMKKMQLRGDDDEDPDEPTMSGMQKRLGMTRHEQ